MDFFLDANTAKRKAFEGLTIQVKNLLTQWKTEEKNQRYEKLGVKNLSTKKGKIIQKHLEL